MNYLQPERLDGLAREYVLGTLSGGARRRFERVLAQAPAAGRAVAAWQERFTVLSGGLPPMAPRTNRVRVQGNCASRPTGRPTAGCCSTLTATSGW